MLSDQQIAEMIEKDKEPETLSQSSSESSTVEQTDTKESIQRDLSQYQPIQELVSTEKTYLHFLDVLDKYFSLPEKKAQGNKILDELSVLLPRIKKVSQTIYENLEQSIRTDLEASELPRLREQRIQLIKLFFTIYPIYSAFFQRYLQEIQTNPKAFEDITTYLNDPKNGAQQLGLSDILIQIIQRGPRYQMLADTIIKNNDNLSAEHPGKLNSDEIMRVKELLELIKALITKANSEIPSLELEKPTASKNRYYFGKYTYEYLTQKSDGSAEKEVPKPVVNTTKASTTSASWVSSWWSHPKTSKPSETPVNNDSQTVNINDEELEHDGNDGGFTFI